MEELKNEQTEQQAHTAQAEKETGVTDSEVSLGKFKDVTALLSAYNSLQSEFTKRCQRVKELESELVNVEKTPVPTQTASEEEQDKKPTEELDKEGILKEYLMGVMSNKPKAVVLSGSGVGVKTPISKPKTIEQAGQLAKELLSKN